MANTASKPSGLVFLTKRIPVKKDFSKVTGKVNGKGTIWTEEEMDALVDMYEAGLSIKEISEYFPHRRETTITTRLWMLRINGVLDPKHGRQIGYAEEHFDQVKYLLDQGDSAREIAEKIGVKYATLRGWLGYWRVRGRLPKTRVDWTPEKKQRLMYLRDCGLSRTEIAEAMELSRSTIQGMIDRMIKSGEAKRINRVPKK